MRGSFWLKKNQLWMAWSSVTGRQQKSTPCHAWKILQMSATIPQLVLGYQFEYCFWDHKYGAFLSFPFFRAFSFLKRFTFLLSHSCWALRWCFFPVFHTDLIHLPPPSQHLVALQPPSPWRQRPWSDRLPSPAGRSESRLICYVSALI